MIKIKRTTTIKGLTPSQLIQLADWLELNEIEFDVEQSGGARSSYNVTVPCCDKSAVLVVLAGCKKEVTR